MEHGVEPLVKAITVADWTPPVLLAPGVAATPRLAAFAAALRAGYQAPAPEFTLPQELLVTGRHFAVVTRAAGLIAASVHTIPRFAWHQAFQPVAGFDFAPGPALVAASAGHGNYYHWTAETLLAAVASRAVAPAGDLPLVVPPLHERWQHGGLAALDITNPLVELAPDRALVLDAGRLTSLAGPAHGLAPHPALLAAMAAAVAAPAPASAARVYLARLDAGDRRRMLNEERLCAVLAAAGCTVVVPGTLTVADQIALVRGAQLIIAPHGSALANLLYVPGGTTGPAVVELFQENYLNRCFAKLCQAKRLRYRALVNRCVDPGEHHHRSTWEADLPLVLAAASP